MYFVCTREGRHDVHVGDVFEVPGEPDAWDCYLSPLTAETAALVDPEKYPDVLALFSAPKKAVKDAANDSPAKADKADEE